MERYRIRVTKDYLAFCCGHFIIFDGNQCERLHGHNYRAAVEVEGPLNEDYLVFDFITLKHILRAITDELDHRMLVPLRSRNLQVEVGEETVHLSYGEKEWTFPRGDCALLPIENTTTELLARWLAERLKAVIAERAKDERREPQRLDILRVEVEEAPGQSALYELTE